MSQRHYGVLKETHVASTPFKGERHSAWKLKGFPMWAECHRLSKTGAQHLPWTTVAWENLVANRRSPSLQRCSNAAAPPPRPDASSFALLCLPVTDVGVGPHSQTGRSRWSRLAGGALKRTCGSVAADLAFDAHPSAPATAPAHYSHQMGD